jgi:hypothetical protein
MHNGIYLALQEASDADLMAQHKLFGKRIIVPLVSSNRDTPISAERSFTPCSLASIFRFDEMVRAVQRHSPAHNIILCTGLDPHVQIRAIFLTGCHMMMTQGFSYTDTVSLLSQASTAIMGSVDAEGLTVACCWRALYRAKTLGWIDFGDIFDTGYDNPSRIFIEEYIHYARCATYPPSSPAPPYF